MCSVDWTEEIPAFPDPSQPSPPAPHRTSRLLHPFPSFSQIRKSPLLCATIGRRYFLSTATAVQYALQQIAGGQLVAPAALLQTVMSSISLGNLDEGGVNDI